MNDTSINPGYFMIGVLAVLFTWILHEFTHWLTCELFGYDTIMYLNSTTTTPSENPSEIHKVFISISGPAITLLQGLIVFLVLKYKGWNKYLYLLLFTPFYMRFLAGLMNFIKANDEGRVSQYLGIGTFTLSIVVSGLLFFMIYWISKENRLNWKFHLWTTIIVMVTSSALILSDQFLGIRLL